MTPLLLLPAALGGYALGVSRKGMSMRAPQKSAPVRGVPIFAWEKFVALMVVAPKKTVAPRGRVGMFGMNARRLSDVGFMKGARKTTVGSEAGVWAGEWVPPLTQQKFLESTPAQYEAFSRSMRRMVPKVAGMVGTPVGGARASLSGLLAVGHLAGEDGVASWVRDPAVREKFRATTHNFEKANGLF
ncbi:MAG TPA: hypothetical protein DCX12_06895 [Chloroflexi bacterium]|jgi:hypothetical protein|nr:hypothetical protein [Chloroflexota bacterium]